jgi:hypothetical protein
MPARWSALGDQANAYATETHHADNEVTQPATLHIYGFQPITVHSAKAAMESSQSAQVEMSSLR